MEKTTMIDDEDLDVEERVWWEEGRRVVGLLRMRTAGVVSL